MITYGLTTFHVILFALPLLPFTIFCFLDRTNDSATHRDDQRWSPSLPSARLCQEAYRA